MQVLSETVSGNRQAATNSLAPNLARIIALIAIELGIAQTPIKGTSKLVNKKANLTEECKIERYGEGPSFQRCRIKKIVDSAGVRGVVLETSVHKHSADS